ncbi:MAG TPA: ABC transporter substrate-binding protein, partial [Blastocatellia bacterium]
NISIAIVTIFLLALLAEASWLAPLQGEGLTPAELRGQQIYRRGAGSSGQGVTAVLGDSGVELPASAVACINCHGREGLGKSEGGVVASNLTWEALTRPYGVATAIGRNRPPYTEALLKRAIGMGLDSAGNKLHQAMPRYRMTHEEIADLIAYLKKLGKDPDPGVTGTSITIGTTLITDGRFREMSQAVRAALAAYFDDINRKGGIFNRRIILQAAESGDSPDDRVKSLRESIDRNQLFAVVSPFMAGADEQLASLVKEKEVPLVGAFTLDPPVGLPLNQYAFYIYPGLVSQSQALAVFAISKYAERKPQAAIIYNGEKPLSDAAAAIKAMLKEAGWDQVEEIKTPRQQLDQASLAQKLSGKSAEVIFLLSDGESQKAFIQQARKINWNPVYLIPGQLAAREILESPRDIGAQVLLSFPTLPSDQTEDGSAEYRRLAESYKLPSQHRPSQLTALASAKILVEALKRAGRDVSRQKLIDALEGLYQFKTALTPPITYNANRRVGSMGAYILAVDPQGHGPSPVSGLIEPD